VAGDDYREGFYSLLDDQQTIQFDRFLRGNALATELQGIDGVQRLMAFTKGFYKLEQRGSRLLITDLRMGQEPNYSFSFAVAERHSTPVALPQPEQTRVSSPSSLRGRLLRSMTPIERSFLACSTTPTVQSEISLAN
jgi:inner membrane protein